MLLYVTWYADNGRSRGCRLLPVSRHKGILNIVVGARLYREVTQHDALATDRRAEFGLVDCSTAEHSLRRHAQSSAALHCRRYGKSRVTKQKHKRNN